MGERPCAGADFSKGAEWAEITFEPSAKKDQRVIKETIDLAMPATADLVTWALDGAPPTRVEIGVEVSRARNAHRTSDGRKPELTYGASRR